MGLCRQVNMRWWVSDPNISVPRSTTPFYRIWVPQVNLLGDDPILSIHQRDRAHLFAVITSPSLEMCWSTTNIIAYGGTLVFRRHSTGFFMKMICNRIEHIRKSTELCLICQIYVDTWGWGGNNISKIELFAWLTLRRWTAFRVIRKAGGSGALARKSSIRELTGAKSFVWRQSSCKETKQKHCQLIQRNSIKLYFSPRFLFLCGKLVLILSSFFDRKLKIVSKQEVIIPEEDIAVFRDPDIAACCQISLY